jgi:hypothetical protein
MSEDGMEAAEQNGESTDAPVLNAPVEGVVDAAETVDEAKASDFEGTVAKDANDVVVCTVLKSVDSQTFTLVPYAGHRTTCSNVEELCAALDKLAREV